MSNCLIVQPIAHAGLDLLREAGLTVHVADDQKETTLRPLLQIVQAVITRNHGLSAAEIEAAPLLEVIVSHGTGMDKIDVEAAARRGIYVTNTPGANTQAVAEHAIALIFACAKSIPSADGAVRNLDFDFRYRQKTFELAGRTLGLVGYGRIARRVARIAQALGLHVLGCSRRAGKADMDRDGVENIGDLDEICARSDILSLHGVPTSGVVLFDERQIALLKPGAVLINTARGSLVDEAALAAALESGHLAAAALDVFTEEPLPRHSELLNCPRLILTPHIGGAALEAMERTATEAARKVIEALGRPSAG